jgi:hypothetical protein
MRWEAPQRDIAWPIDSPAGCPEFDPAETRLRISTGTIWDFQQWTEEDLRFFRRTGKRNDKTGIRW